MPVRIAIDGKFSQEKDGLKFSGKGGELTAITSLTMDFTLEAGLTECKACCLVIRVTRDADQGKKEDLLASKYQFGKANRGEEWRFPGEVWLIDDNATGAEAAVGRFELHNAQVMVTNPQDAGGPPTEEVVIHAYEWTYFDIRGGNKQLEGLAQDGRLAKVKAYDAPQIPKE